MNMLQGLKIYQGSKIKHVYKHTNISSGNECNWTNTEQLVFTKPCPQKGSMKTWKNVSQTFQFRLNLSGTEPQFAEIFRYYFTEAEIIQNRGFRSTLRPLPFNVSGNLEFRAVKFYFRIPASIFNHLYQELFGTENPDFPAGKSGIPGPTFEGSKVCPRYVRAGLPKVIGTPTVESM